MIRSLVTASSIALASAAAAHPHVFVEAEVDIVFDAGGEMTGVRLTWIYDDFFSFMLTAELGLDPQGSLQLTPEEQEVLATFVLDWPDNFGGDLQVTQNGRQLDLAAPQQQAVEYRDGRVMETHVRPLRTPADAAVPVDVQVFDPYYYVAYEIVGDIGVIGREGCDIRFNPADLTTAYAMLEEILFGQPAFDMGADDYDFPAVGDAFADTVTVRCAP
ncbi:MAG: DUF1007 family protein [Rubellimicrobium sp.]|nr:DUF1007 family protein [Rubellimicrobium sp.]